MAEPPAKRPRRLSGLSRSSSAKMAAARQAISQRLESLTAAQPASDGETAALRTERLSETERKNERQTGTQIWRTACVTNPLYSKRATETERGPQRGREMSCTACERSISGSSVWPHPSLHHVAVCEPCFIELCDDTVEQEKQRELKEETGEGGRETETHSGTEEEHWADLDDSKEETEVETDGCAWCLESGIEVLCCDHCPRAYCERCILHNLGRAELQQVKEADPWSCYHCDSLRLSVLQAAFISAAATGAEAEAPGGQRDREGQRGTERAQILIDQLMAIEEEIDDANRSLEQSHIDRLMQEIRTELQREAHGKTEAAIEETVAGDLAEYIAQCRHTEGCLQARKLAVMDALEPLLRLQGTSVLTVLKEREKMIKRVRESQRESERADDPWGHSVVQCCESDSEEDTGMAEGNRASIEPAIAEIDTSEMPEYARVATRVLNKRDREGQRQRDRESHREPLSALYTVETPSEAIAKGLSGAVVEIADVR